MKKDVTKKGTNTTITKHYIDGAFVESHGREVMDIINPTSGEVIAHVTLADEEDARRAISGVRKFRPDDEGRTHGDPGPLAQGRLGAHR